MLILPPICMNWFLLYIIYFNKSIFSALAAFPFFGKTITERVQACTLVNIADEKMLKSWQWKCDVRKSKIYNILYQTHTFIEWFHVKIWYAVKQEIIRNAMCGTTVKARNKWDKKGYDDTSRMYNLMYLRVYFSYKFLESKLHFFSLGKFKKFNLCTVLYVYLHHISQKYVERYVI